MIQNKIGKPPTYSQPPGATYSESHVEVPVKDPQPPWSNIFASIPQTLGTLAVAAVKFVTPKAPADKSGVNRPGGRPSATVSEVRPLIDLEDPSTLTMGMLGVAAVTGLSYAVTSSFASEDSEDNDDDAESKTNTNLFELYGPEHFLTNFDNLDWNNLKRSFDNIVSAKLNNHATQRRQRRRRRNVQIRAKSYKPNQPYQLLAVSSSSNANTFKLKRHQ